MVCGVAVEIPLAGESGEVGEDSKGNHFAGAEGGVGSGASLLLRAGVAEIVDHNVECGEEGVHIDHGPVPFPLGSGSKPTLVRGHLPLKFRVDNSHQTSKPLSISGADGIRTHALRRAKAHRLILARPSASGNFDVLQVFCELACGSMSVAYRLGCSTVAVRS